MDYFVQSRKDTTDGWPSVIASPLWPAAVVGRRNADILSLLGLGAILRWPCFGTESTYEAKVTARYRAQREVCSFISICHAVLSPSSTKGGGEANHCSSDRTQQLLVFVGGEGTRYGMYSGSVVVAITCGVLGLGPWKARRDEEERSVLHPTYVMIVLAV